LKNENNLPVHKGEFNKTEMEFRNANSKTKWHKIGALPPLTGGRSHGKMVLTQKGKTRWKERTP